jgi:hypothetical protein
MGALVNDRTIYERASAGVTAFRDDMEALKHNFLLRGFFKKRGYDDPTELTKHQIPQLPPKPYIRKFVYDASKLFDKPETAKLDKEKSLNEAGKFLEQNPFGVTVVASYADMKGDSDKDRMLTEARAMVVRDYLVKNFKLDDTRVKTIGLRKTEDDSNKVEILVYPVGTNLNLASRSRAKR